MRNEEWLNAALAPGIRQLRSRLNLKQGQFARQISVAQQTVSDWENGKRLTAANETGRAHD